MTSFSHVLGITKYVMSFVRTLAKEAGSRWLTWIEIWNINTFCF